MHANPTHPSIPQPLRTAVLFLVFNRLDTTRQVFEEIRKVRPPRLYLAADGARNSRPGEDGKVKAVRDYVLDHVDWHCETRTLFRDKNLGCKCAVSGAIDWFFKNEEMGIVLEDDTLPSRTFFPFCEELLVRYRDEKAVMHISGFNPLAAYPIDASYCLSRFGPIWGWASWRRAWKSYDVSMASWPQKRPRLLLDGMVQTATELRWRQRIFDKVYSNQVDTWDYQWSYARLAYGGLSVVPRVSLVSNIGFLSDSTHTRERAPDHFLQNYELDFPLSHPSQTIEDQRFGTLYLEHFAMPRKQDLVRRITRRIVSTCGDRHSRRKRWNVLLDEGIRPLLSSDGLVNAKECSLLAETCDQSSDSFWLWLGKANSEFLTCRFPHKKALEFYFSGKLLDVRSDDVVLDAAGGRSEYLSQIKHNTGCRNLYLHDQIYANTLSEVSGVTIVGGDVTRIALPDCSITRIACHHALEHFRGDKDIKFVGEISRLLRPGGKACIIPVFLSDTYAEVWNIEPEDRHDARALCLMDRTASLPGADEDGHFARVYDSRALMERIVRTALSCALAARVVECTLDGRAIPDMSVNFGSKINCPLRALVLEKPQHG